MLEIFRSILERKFGDFSWSVARRSCCTNLEPIHAPSIGVKVNSHAGPILQIPLCVPSLPYLPPRVVSTRLTGQAELGTT
jgi:hypothetical protein